jgi:hypothetical protein
VASADSDVLASDDSDVVATMSRTRTGTSPYNGTTVATRGTQPDSLTAGQDARRRQRIKTCVEDSVTKTLRNSPRLAQRHARAWPRQSVETAARRLLDPVATGVANSTCFASGYDAHANAEAYRHPGRQHWPALHDALPSWQASPRCRLASLVPRSAQEYDNGVCNTDAS